VVLKMLPFRISPYSLLALAVLVLGLAQAQDETVTVNPGFDLTNFENTDATLQGCDPDKISFELVTGFVYSAPSDMLDSQPGTLMLTDCIDMCRNNRSCLSVNYETGLCVLFSSNADMYPGALTASQFPVFTLYVQKNCFKANHNCDRAWSFERVMGYQLDGFSKKSRQVSTREDCQELCLSEKEFPCRSANFNNQTGDCNISDMDRHTVVGSGAFKPAANTDFLEANCVDDPVKLCEFQKMDGRILKTVDSVYQDIETLEDCKKLCLAAPFRCHSFDFGDTGDKVCRLSHHAAATLTHIEEPYLDIDGSSTYELSSCYNVTIDCRSGDLIARIKTSKIFDGKIYAKGSPTTCVNDIESSLEFEIQMSYNDVECNVQRVNASRYSTDVVIQHHDMIVTSADLGLSVHCQYDLSNKSVSNRVDLTVTGEPETALKEGAVVDSPNVIMRVANRDGGDITEASVGDMLQLRFEIVDRNSPYEIFVRDLIAMDGGDGNQITLLDSRGCPTEISIMRALLKIENTNGKVLGASFDAFKFPTSDVVQFRALVTPCLPSCEPVICDVMDFGGQVRQTESYGRKKRSTFVSHFSHGLPSSFWDEEVMIINSNTMDIEATEIQLQSSNSRRKRAADIPDELLMVQTIKIKDKFGFRAQSQSRENAINRNEIFNTETNTLSGGEEMILSEDVSGVCINMVGLILACSVFLIAQLVIIVAWTAVWHRRRRNKLEEPLSPSTTTESLRQLYDSGYPRRI